VLGWFDGSVRTRTFNRALSDYYTRYGHEGALRSWLVLSTHDTPRLRSVLPDDAERELALVLQFTLPGEPVVYYGEENGMRGGEDPDNCRPMRWDSAEWDEKTRAFYRKLTAIRGARRELREGRLLLLSDYVDEGAEAVAYVRHTEAPNQEALIVVNRGTKPLQQRLMIPHTQFYPTLHLKNLLAPDDAAQRIEFRHASVRLDLPPRTAAIYVPDDSQPNYAFFKPRILGGNWP
jgi:glycosidase